MPKTYCGLKRPLKGLLSLGLELDSSLLLTFSLCRTVIASKKQFLSSQKGSRKEGLFVIIYFDRSIYVTKFPDIQSSKEPYFIENKSTPLNIIGKLGMKIW